MGGGRLDFILSAGGPILIGLLLLGGLAQYVMRRNGAQKGAALDEFGGGNQGDAEAGASSLRRIHPNFLALLEAVVMPRIAAHPEWERLDGAYGVPGQQISQFAHGDAVYAINGESRMAALAAVYHWLIEHPGEDALMTGPMRKGVGRLVIRPEVGWPKADDIRLESV
ncbi:hypothetical protein [Roseomonas populi]|uniref:Uncharacterized protein n=1 Tax=Roseomonas populi TaxID=3121582 RepID=A0ABT1X0U3_9PROT|nr:hypothetical protein [Roseomonas pecuniae]MCR0981718.1 hypothetical protein [Roseomonas pecuniae]